MKIKALVNLKSFQPVINLKWADVEDERINLLENYILTEDLAELFAEILETINMKRSENRCEKLGGDIDPVNTLRSHIIRGQYGTGKSYFLLMLSIILESGNSKLAEQLMEKAKDFPELYYQLKYIANNKNYLVVRINGENENEKYFDDLIQRAIIKGLENEFEEVILKSNYQNLLETLISHKEHKIRSQLLDNAFKNKNYSYQDLLSGLKACQRKAKFKYQEIMKESGLNIGEEFKNLEEFITDVDNFLKSKGYDGLIIILDEFSAYLDTSIESGRSRTDLANVDTLAEASIPTSRYNLSFVVSTHEDMGNILNQVYTNQETVNKVFRRFKQQVISFNQGKELIKDMIRVKKSRFNKFKEKHLALITNLEKQYKMKVEDYYPLHPATVDYLQPVAQKFAQKDATLFVFLKEVVREKYFEQRVEQDGKLNFVTLDDIFDEFLSAFEQDSNLIKVYNQMNQIAQNELEEKINKALVISYISLLSTSAGIDRTAGLSVDDLKNIFLEDEDQVAQALDNLDRDDRSALVLNDGKYQLMVSNTGIDLDREISKGAQDINPYQEMRDLLRANESNLEVKRNYDLKYNLGIYPLSRELEGKLITVGELLEVNDLNNYLRTYKDAKIIFIVPDFNENYDCEDLKDKYKIELSDLAPNLALALPKKIYFDQKDLKEYGAIKKLETNKDIINNEELSQLLVKRKRKIRDKIWNKYLRKFAMVNNFVFIFGGQLVRDDIRQDKELFKELLYRYYNKFPNEIKVENFDSRAASNSVIKKMIDTGECLLSKNSTSVFQKQVFNTLVPLDLVKTDEQPNNYKIQMKVPEETKSQKSYQIWQIIMDEQMPIRDKFDTLENAPYGLNQSLIELYIAVALALGKLRLREMGGAVINAPNKDHIVRIKVSDYIMEEVPEPDVEKKEQVKEIWTIFAKLITNSQVRKFDPRGKSEDSKFFSIIAGELKDVIDKLDNYQDIFINRNLEVFKLEGLKEALKNAKSSSYSPEELYENLIGLVKNYSESSYDATLKEIEYLLNSLLDFREQKDRVSDFSNKLDSLRGKIHILKGHDNLKEKFVPVKKAWKEYQSNPFDFELISDMEDKLELAIAEYNQVYKREHDKYYQSFIEAREKILKNEEERIDIIRTFEKIDFKNIAKINSYIKKLNAFEACTDLNINQEQVAVCSCDLNSLKAIENKAGNIDGQIEHIMQKIANIYIHYIEKLNSEKEKFKKYLRAKDATKIDDWKFIIGAINDDAITYKEELKERLESVLKLLNQYLGKDPIDPITKQISLDKFVEKMESKVKAYGLNTLKFSDIKKIVATVCKELVSDEDYQELKIENDQDD